MYLLIDLSELDVIHLALFDGEKIEEVEYEGRNRELLVSLDAFFNKQNFKKENLLGIMIVVGKGSFTSTRISAVVAKTFAFVLDIPLLAISAEQVDQVQKLIPQLKKQKKGQYISAIYSAPPNIGK